MTLEDSSRRTPSVREVMTRMLTEAREAADDRPPEKPQPAVHVTGHNNVISFGDLRIGSVPPRWLPRRK